MNEGPAGGRSVTIRDVARHAQVSIGTVSHVLNGQIAVRPETRTRVEQAIVALGFQENLVAKSLRRRATRVIGLLVSDLANPLFATVAKSASQELQANGYLLLLGSTAHRDEE